MFMKLKMKAPLDYVHCTVLWPLRIQICFFLNNYLNFFIISSKNNFLRLYLNAVSSPPKFHENSSFEEFELFIPFYYYYFYETDLESLKI